MTDDQLWVVIISEHLLQPVAMNSIYEYECIWNWNSGAVNQSSDVSGRARSGTEISFEVEIWKNQACWGMPILALTAMGLALSSMKAKIARIQRLQRPRLRVHRSSPKDASLQH